MPSLILLLLVGIILFLFSMQIVSLNLPISAFMGICGFLMFSFACIKLDDAKSPEKQHEEYSQTIEDTNQKFYIEHPKFKENCE